MNAPAALTARDIVIAAITAASDPSEFLVHESALAADSLFLGVLQADDETATYREVFGYATQEAAEAAVAGAEGLMVGEYVIDLSAPVAEAVRMAYVLDGFDVTEFGEPFPFDEDHVSFA